MYKKLKVIGVCLIFVANCKKDTYRTYVEIKNNPHFNKPPSSYEKHTSSNEVAKGQEISMIPMQSDFPETLTYTLPKNWEEIPSGKMVMKTFALNSQTKSEAKITLSVFPGDVGGVSANVSRWAKQIDITDVAAIQKVLVGIVKKQGKRPFLYVNYLALTAGHQPSMLGGVYRFRDKTLFVKLSGHHHELEKNQVEFVAFLKSIK